MNLVRRPLTDLNLLRALVRFPLVTLKTVAMIHWHAFHLWRKGATFHSHRSSRAVERDLLPERH